MSIGPATESGWRRLRARLGRARQDWAEEGREAVATGVSAPPAAPDATAPWEEADQAFVDFLKTAFDPAAYRHRNPDVAADGADPLAHWLRHGLGEGRGLPGFEMMRGPAAERRRPGWERFTWHGEALAFRPGSAFPVDAEIFRQIRAQAWHEPAVNAPGARAIAGLPRYLAPDLLRRDGLDWPALLASLPSRPATMLVMPFLLAGGAEKYAADLVAALTEGEPAPILVLVTDQTAAEAGNWQDLAILAPLRAATVVFWPDLFDRFGHANPAILARFANALAPRRLVVVNSRVGLDAVAQFGRGLSQHSQLVCAYFSMGHDGLGAPYGTRFPRLTLPFAAALTDNRPMAETLQRLHGDMPGPGIAVIPPRLVPAPAPVFAARLAARRARAGAPPAGRRWAWVSRIEPFKGTAVLAALADLRPADRFDVYGPGHATAAAAGLDRPNITCHPPLPDVGAADFTAHDGFLFTSLFEGLPNVVLEMTQHAIPLVLAEVGGLRDTFDDAAALFVRHAETPAASAARFSAALDRLVAMPAEAVAGMVAAARAAVIARHAPEAHGRAVRRFLDAA